MGSSEKDRLATEVVEQWCSFQEALAGTKRKYPTQEFFSFVEAARRYIGVTRNPACFALASMPSNLQLPNGPLIPRLHLSKRKVLVDLQALLGGVAADKLDRRIGQALGGKPGS